MNTYKITNISNLVGKRDNKFNAELDIEYIDNMVKKVSKLKPNESLFLTVHSLPLSVHRLRIKNLISVTEVSREELETMLESSKPKAQPKPVVEEDEKSSAPAKKTTKKKK